MGFPYEFHEVVGPIQNMLLVMDINMKVYIELKTPGMLLGEKDIKYGDIS